MLGAEFVDILCIGSGGAGLAAGVAGASAGLEVFVAEPNREAAAPTRAGASSVESWLTILQRRWGAEEFNAASINYLDQLTSSLGPPAPIKAGGHLREDTVETFAAVDVDPTEPVPPFRGEELATWARECLTSPFGMILSRVSPSTLKPVRKVDGTSVNAGFIASVPAARRRDTTVRQWLAELAGDTGVEVHQSCSIQRLLFSDGQLVGAVLDTPDGVRTVRARRGVVLGTSCAAVDDTLRMSPMAGGGEIKLCAVGKTASRFSRLEFLLSAAAYSACAAPARLA
jgi:hypothetical protein